MSITYGFYNSLNHDRKYNATQMARIFDGIIKDGIFMSIGDCFAVHAGTGMNVIVGSGKAWFNHTWTENDADLPVTAFQSEVVLARKDALVLEVDATDSARVNSIKFVKGIPSSNPVAPTLINTATVHQHLLVTVTIPAGATAITDAMIENFIGTTTTPFVSGILETVDLDTLLGQWKGMLNDFQATNEADFGAWFTNMQNQLTTDAAGKLQTQIDGLALKANMSIYVATTGNDTTGTGTSTNPYKTWAKALSVAAKNQNGYDVTLYIAGGTYAESVLIKGFHGGTLIITLQGNVTLNAFTIFTGQYVYVNASSSVTLTITNTTSTAFTMGNAAKARFNNTVSMIINSTTALIGIFCHSLSDLCFEGGMSVYNAKYGIYMDHDCKAYIATLAGTGNVTGIYGGEGSIFSYGTKTIAATIEKQMTGGAIITNEIEALGKEDMIINGGFNIWQRGTSQTSSGYGSDDRWQNESAGSTKTHSRQAFAVGQTEVPNNPTYFSRTAVTSVAGGHCNKYQHIEDVTKLSGKTVTLSFWAKADAAKKLCVEFLQNFGTGGSTYIPGISPTTFNLTTAWKRYTVTITFPSVSGKTIGPNNSSMVNFWFDASTAYDGRTNSIGQQSGTFDIANVTMVEGKMAREWQPENLTTLMAKCKRYYQTLGFGLTGIAYTTSSIFFNSLFEEMRGVPTASVDNYVIVYGFGLGGDTGTGGITCPTFGASTHGIKYIVLSGWPNNLTIGKTYGVATDPCIYLDAEL